MNKIRLSLLVGLTSLNLVSLLLAIIVFAII